MGRAIEAHVESHKLKIKNPNEATAEADRIREFLTTQVLQKASQLE
jgi:hypothetical protein